MIWLALLNAFCCGLQVSLLVWNVAERRYDRVIGNASMAVLSAFLACVLAVRV